MIESPSAMGYFKISVYASLATFAVIAALLLGIMFSRTPAPRVLHSLPCDAPLFGDTRDWMEIEAGDHAWLTVPASMRPVEVHTYVGRHDRSWVTPDNSLAVTVANTRRGDDRYPKARILGPVVEDDDGHERGCPFRSIDGHAASIETSHFSSDNGSGYLEVFAQVDEHADSVIRITVTANSQQGQRAGLTIVRSLRFITGPPPT